MRKMMEGVVLLGTGRRAMLDGYTAAGKTGTAQKVDHRTGRYGSKYVASFIGFAPVNQPAVTVAVILDSAAGLHQGGQVSAPVFQRVAQQVLEYLHVPHDTELRNQNRLLMQAAVKDRDLEEDSPDHPGEVLQEAETADASSGSPAPAPAASPGTQLVLAARVQPAFVPQAQAATIPVGPAGALQAPGQPGPEPRAGVIVNMDTVVVPSLLGKSMRSAVEAVQESGMVLDAHGSGVAREQSPLPGARVPRGGRVAVRFAR
jgi:cell division protein FtsI (penicillin-binding protein 3)